ncbi:hypothetical protein PSAB6_180124 [Paraburkholderia sabiae]|nr:hypothetical protein PSAB6_180124 [Paraburkholderia sabiae]
MTRLGLCSWPVLTRCETFGLEWAAVSLRKAVTIAQALFFSNFAGLARPVPSMRHRFLPFSPHAFARFDGLPTRQQA